MDLDRLEKLAKSATPGPWGWRGYDDGNIELRARHSGGLRIITTSRTEPCTGMTSTGEWVLLESACPTCADAYRTADIENTGKCEKWENRDTIWVKAASGGYVEPINKHAVREVPYRADIVGTTHPDAEFIAAVDPQTVLQLIAENRVLRSALEGHRAGDEVLLDLMGGEEN